LPAAANRTAADAEASTAEPEVANRTESRIDERLADPICQPFPVLRHTLLPDLKLEFAVATDHLKIGAIRCDQAGPERARRERKEDVEMQVAQLVRLNPLFARIFARIAPDSIQFLRVGSKG
jgi:hypothetical protein